MQAYIFCFYFQFFLFFTYESGYCFQRALAIAILSVRHTGGSVKNGAR